MPPAKSPAAPPRLCGPREALAAFRRAPVAGLRPHALSDDGEVAVMSLGAALPPKFTLVAPYRVVARRGAVFDELQLIGPGGRSCRTAVAWPPPGGWDAARYARELRRAAEVLLADASLPWEDDRVPAGARCRAVRSHLVRSRDGVWRRNSHRLP